MTYIVERPTVAPHFQLGILVGWEELVPDIKRRADISTLFHSGRFALPSSPYQDLPEAEVPRVLLLDGRPKRIPDIFTSENGVVVVQQPLKEVVESLDPGVHQFLPIDVQRRYKGPGPEHPCFVMHVRPVQDSIVDAESSVRPFYMYEETHEAMEFLHLTDARFVVRKLALSGVNLWREKRFPGSMLMSDALHDALKAAGLKFHKLHKAEEV